MEGKSTESPAPVAREGLGVTAKLIIKNTAYLTAAQVLTIPISIGLNAAMGRYLGAEAFGAIYFATTLATFGFLLVNWGHAGVLPMVVAQDREVSGEMLGSSLAWRAALSGVVYAVLALALYLLDYSTEIQVALLIVYSTQALISVHAACKDTIRGFERTDLPAAIHVIQQLVTAAFTLPALMLGGGIEIVLGMAIVSHVALLPPVFRLLKGVGVGRLSVSRPAVTRLFQLGGPWVALGLTMEVQPNIDALYLSKLAPAEVMGWYAVSRRLIGPLLLPATALIGAMYPTLCRLHSTDPDGFVRAARGTIRNVSLIVVPLALCTGLFPEVGVAIFSRDSFGGAEDNLRVLAVFLFLLYFSMPISQAVLAAGGQKVWAVVQAVCVASSLVLDPLLIPHFQESHGNGGIGLCVAAVIAESLVVICGLFLLPKKILDWALAKSLILCCLSGVPMFLVAYWLGDWPALVVAPIALAAYAGAAWVTGALEREHYLAVAELVARKAGNRFRRKK